MSNKTKQYKGYIGNIDVSVEDGVMFGQIECINDLVSYEADTVPAIQAAFEEAVDDYLETCEELNRDPDKTFSGTFNTRVGPELHKKLYLEKAKGSYSSINEVLISVLKQHFTDTPKPTADNHYHFYKESSVTKETAIENWSESISGGFQFIPTYTKRTHHA